ncbi:MAG: hypothetical protein AAF961_10810, partial [Planctomycetota bacterium]
RLPQSLTERSACVLERTGVGESYPLLLSCQRIVRRPNRRRDDVTVAISELRRREWRSLPVTVRTPLPAPSFFQ